MFNNKPDNEADFCESYKSQILNNHLAESESSVNNILKTLIIILVLALIIGFVIYGYSYLKNDNIGVEEGSPSESSLQIIDDDLKVTIEELTEEELLEAVENSVEKVEEKNPKTSQKLSTTSVKEESEKVTPKKVSEKIKVIMPPVSIQTSESDIDKLANELKLSLSESEENKNNRVDEKSNEKALDSVSIKTKEESNLEVPLSTSPESKYLEELAELSKELDQEMKQ